MHRAQQKRSAFDNQQQLYTVSRELDDTKQLLQEQQKLFSETYQVLCDLRSENEFNKILKARSDIHLSISQNALAEAVAENSTLKEQLTVAQSDSTFYERAHNAIWAALCSVWSTLDPGTEDHGGCDRAARSIEDIPPQALRPTRRAEKQGSSGGAHRRCATPCGMGSRTAHHLAAWAAQKRRTIADVRTLRDGLRDRTLNGSRRWSLDCTPVRRWSPDCAPTGVAYRDCSWAIDKSGLQETVGYVVGILPARFADYWVTRRSPVTGFGDLRVSNHLAPPALPSRRAALATMAFTVLWLNVQSA
jgi:hypothetical protein